MISLIMGNVHSCVIASFSLFSVYLVYVHVYRAHTVLKSSVLHSDRMPSSAYFCVKYVLRACTRTPGCLYAAAETRHVVYTLLNCRLQTPVLRSFCSVAGYGWDYPDSEHRDVPLSFPEFLCSRLMLVLLTDGNFRLSPAGLIRVRQTLKTLQPVDELKKGRFTLQVEVVAYRRVDAGVEVDVRLSAASRLGCPVWESILTLLSRHKLHTSHRNQQDSGRSDEVKQEQVKQEQVEQVQVEQEQVKQEQVEQVQVEQEQVEQVKQVQLRAPQPAGLQMFSSVFSSHRLLSRLFSAPSAPPLWMLSVCLAEIEKHKGVGVVTAPVSVQVQFMDPLAAPADVTVAFWETSREEDRSSPPGTGFHMERHGSSHLVGLISRS